MPELPDVEIQKQYLDACALHKKIRQADVRDPSLVKGGSGRALERALEGKRLRSTRRHGKHLFASLDGGAWLRLHFGMTGDLAYGKLRDDEPEHTRLRLDFPNEYALAYTNMRKLGELELVEDPDGYVDEQKLGIDPLDRGFTIAALRDALRGRQGTIKSTLMNQQVLAGIGNVYSDEILLETGLHPKARPHHLRDETLEELHHAIKKVLRDAIKARVQPDRFPRRFILPHREEGAACPRCGRTLRQITISGRTSYFCPHDQRRKT